MFCLFGGRKEPIFARIQLQPVAPHDVVVYHVSEDEWELGLEDLMIKQVLIAVGLRLQSWL